MSKLFFELRHLEEALLILEKVELDDFPNGRTETQFNDAFEDLKEVLYKLEQEDSK